MTESLGDVIKDATREKLGFMTAEELAMAIGVTVTTLQTWRVQDTGPRYVKLGKGVFYRYKDVQAWAAECLSPQTGPGAQVDREQEPSAGEAVA